MAKKFDIDCKGATSCCATVLMLVHGGLRGCIQSQERQRLDRGYVPRVLIHVCACAGLSLLDTPSYVILLVFVCFLVLSGTFEQVPQTACTSFSCLTWPGWPLSAINPHEIGSSIGRPMLLKGFWCSAAACCLGKGLVRRTEKARPVGCAPKHAARSDAAGSDQLHPGGLR